MGKTATAKQEARLKARQRRLELDAHRDARDRRVEDATAEALLLVAQRADAEDAVIRANVSLGHAVRTLIDEGVSFDGIAQVIDVDVAEVRRVARTGAQLVVQTGAPDQTVGARRGVRRPAKAKASTGVSVNDDDAKGEMSTPPEVEGTSGSRAGTDSPA